MAGGQIGVDLAHHRGVGAVEMAAGGCWNAVGLGERFGDRVEADLDDLDQAGAQPAAVNNLALERGLDITVGYEPAGLKKLPDPHTLARNLSEMAAKSEFSPQSLRRRRSRCKDRHLESH